MRVRESVYTVYQSGDSCSWTLPVTRQFLSAAGGSINVAEQTSVTSCILSATTSDNWISVLSPPLKGNGAIKLQVAANGGAARTGIVTIGGQPFTVTQGASANGAGPFFLASGILNSASYEGGGVSPAEILTIYGSNLGPASLVSAVLEDGKFPTLVGGVRVLMNGQAIPLIYVSQGQIACIARGGLTAGANADIQVENNGQLSPVVRISTVAGKAGIFSSDASGRGQAAALNQDASFNGSWPSSIGWTPWLYFTGPVLARPIRPLRMGPWS